MARSGCKLALLLALMLTACSSCAASPQVAPDGYASVGSYVRHQTAVRIAVLCLGGDVIVGSGTVVSPDVVLTAKHVALACERPGRGGTGVILVMAQDEEQRLAVVLDQSLTDDVATLSIVDSPKFTVHATPAPTMPRIDDTVCWTGGDKNITVNGVTKCGLYGAYNKGYRMTLVAGKGAPGNSGSGVFNSKGQLIGVLSVGKWEPDEDFVTGIVPVDKFRELLP